MAFDQIEVLPGREALARHAANWLLDIAAATDGRLSIALAGGSTPRRLYEMLAEPASRDRLDWCDTHWFWGDERFVPHSDARSNYRMAHEALLSRMPIPEANIHPVPTAHTTPADAANAYAQALKRYYGATGLDPARPFFDVVLLGLGTDGHTASLFPGTNALEEHEHWAVAVDGDHTEPRITLTYPLLNSCRHAVFLVTGSNKREILKRLRHGDAALPAAGIQPSGTLCCFADADAAGVAA